MHRIIKRAKLTPWQRTFQNMRSTRETELAEHFPMHVVNKWIGNTESVAVQHYLQVTSDHFERAGSEFDGDGFELDIDAIFEQAAQNQAQSEQNSKEPEMTDDDNEKPQVPEESGTCGGSRCKSLSDKDLRVPPGGVEQLADSGEELLITSGALHQALHQRRLVVLAKLLMRVTGGKKRSCK